MVLVCVANFYIRSSLVEPWRNMIIETATLNIHATSFAEFGAKKWTTLQNIWVKNGLKLDISSPF